MNLTPHRLPIRTWIFLGVVVCIGGFLVILRLSDSVDAAVTRIGILATILGVLWWLYEKILWRIPFFRLRGFLCSRPVLRGRWEGTIDRTSENAPHPFVIEIVQNLTSMQVYTYSERGNSQSFIAAICSDEAQDTFKLVYSWLGQTTGLVQGQPSGIFQGTTMLDIIGSLPTTLKGEYYTNRIPRQTRGTINVHWVGKERRRSYR